MLNTLLKEFMSNTFYIAQEVFFSSSIKRKCKEITKWIQRALKFITHINLSTFGLWRAKIRSGTNFFHSVIVDGKGIFEKIMMKSEEWNIASVSSGVMFFQGKLF